MTVRLPPLKPAPPLTVTNTALVSSTNTDSNLANNSSSVTTNVLAGLSGATRTIGFYQTHPDFVTQCLSRNGGAINLGWLTVRNEAYDNQIDAMAAGNGADKDSDVETALDLAMGVLKANVTKWSNNKARSSLEKARMQAGRQLLAAICNSATAVPPFSLSAAQQTLAGTNINAILTVSAQADSFNNSGDSIPLDSNPGPANPGFPYDDPTDPND